MTVLWMNARFTQADSVREKARPAESRHKLGIYQLTVKLIYPRFVRNDIICEKQVVGNIIASYLQMFNEQWIDGVEINLLLSPAFKLTIKIYVILHML